jgi:hypothetical protein
VETFIAPFEITCHPSWLLVDPYLLILYFQSNCVNSHCKRFAQTYSEVAEYIHKQNKDGQRKVMVAKIDGSKEKALTSRFSVKG